MYTETHYICTYEFPDFFVWAIKIVVDKNKMTIPIGLF